MDHEAESTTPTTPENGDSDHGFEKLGDSEHTEEPTSTTSQPDDEGTSSKWMKNVDPKGNGQLLSHVVDLLYWRCPKKTGIVFASMMLVLISLCCYSLLSVVSYMALAMLTVTFSFRVYKSVLAAVQKTNEGHPFKQILEFDINLSEDRIRPAFETVLKHINCTTKELRRLFLVEDYVDTIKFGLLLWVLTYVGGWFNGMTLLILAVVAVFTLPKVYETNQTQIDQYIDLASTQVKSAVDKMKAKLPFLKQKKQKAQ